MVLKKIPKDRVPDTQPSTLKLTSRDLLRIQNVAFKLLCFVYGNGIKAGTIDHYSLRELRVSARALTSEQNLALLGENGSTRGTTTGCR